MLFQSPSLRGSGRFVRRRRARRRVRRVSIPFIAGQWSLPASWIYFLEVRGMFQSPSLRGSDRFALSASRRCPSSSRRFQSPSLRGSGRFRPSSSARGWRRPSFNPLHCGAVVASDRGPRRGGGAREGFKPLHCGAVVASRNGWWVYFGTLGFNPLHCGAVVASVWRQALADATGHVSQSPSLRGSGRFVRVPRGGSELSASQSPSLRGSGRFIANYHRVSPICVRLNPLHCGAVVAS